MGRDTLDRDGELTDPDTLAPKEAFHLVAALPRLDGEEGDPARPIYHRRHAELARRLGYLVAATEWNWNGWGDAFPPDTPDFGVATALGASRYLHGLIRQGDVYRIGTQSMMLGTSWAISGVYVREGRSPTITPTAMATSLYARYHGDERVAVRWLRRPPVIEQDAQVGGRPVTERMSLIDAVATRGDDMLYLHLAHVGYNHSATVELDLSAYAGRLADAPAVAYRLVPSGDHAAGRFDATVIVREELGEAAAAWRAELPPRSVSVVRIPLKPNPAE